MKFQDNKVFWIVLFFISSSLAILINKYILWKLRFAYPSVFQSWQMFVAALILISAHSGDIVTIRPISTSSFRRWLPLVFLFTVSIYSGSKALSMLPVPIFCLIQQTFLLVTIHVVEIYKTKKRPSNYQGACIAAAFFCLWLAYLFDNDSENQVKYTWILLNCFCICFYSMYASFLKSLKMQEIDKLFLNAKSSVVLLLLFGIYTGETSDVFNYQYLHDTFFHLLFLGSGFFGALVMLSYGQLCCLFSLPNVRFFNVVSMLIVSIVAIIMSEPMTANVSNLWIAVFGLVFVVNYSYSIAEWSNQHEISKQTFYGKLSV